MLFYRRITILENERAILFNRGKIRNILEAGSYWINKMILGDAIDIHNIESGVFKSPYLRALFKEYPEICKDHLIDIQPSKNEICLIERDKNLFHILFPEERITLWKDAGPWKIETLDIQDTIELDEKMSKRLNQHTRLAKFTNYEVPEGYVGLLYLNYRFEKILPSGIHRFWNVATKVNVTMADLRNQSIDVQGQEILTKDKVSIRVNLAAEYKIIDPIKAINETKDYKDLLYRTLQYAFRLSLGTRTLDQILEDKVTVDSEASNKVRQVLENSGVEVGDIAIKDIILPGEVRDMLNQVVMASKLAEANVIKRREETAATRSLLNTTKLMQENPIMLRLKEIESLENIAANVDQLTIHNGTQGLINDLVKLRD